MLAGATMLATMNANCARIYQMAARVAEKEVGGVGRRTANVRRLRSVAERASKKPRLRKSVSRS